MEIEKNPQDDGEVTSDTFDRDDEDTEETEDAPTETDAGANEEDDTTEESEESNTEEEMQLEDDEDSKSSRRTGRDSSDRDLIRVATTAKRRRGRAHNDYEEDETNASSIMYFPSGRVLIP